MAMTKCKECKQDVSTKATTCPNCGVNNPGVNLGDGLKGLAILFVCGFLITMCAIKDKPEKPAESPKPKTAAELRKEEIEKCFSAWDGSHNNLELLVKKSMNDPESYEHDQTTYSDKGDHLIVKMTFRGKNAFGGVVKSTVIAKTALNCNVTEIISEN
jgi:hypothetical protein